MGVKAKARDNFIQSIKRTLKIDTRDAEDFVEIYSDMTRGRVYRIDQNMQISHSGCRLEFPDIRDSRNNTCSLLNGEWITSDRTGKTIHKFMVYDCYLHYGEWISHYMLTKNASRPTIYNKKTNGSRLLMAEDIIDSIVKQNTNVLFELKLKEFKEANEITRNVETCSCKRVRYIQIVKRIVESIQKWLHDFFNYSIQIGRSYLHTSRETCWLDTYFKK